MASWKWVKSMQYYNIIGGNRVQVFRMNGLWNGDLGIINVYAPNGPINICNLWELMKEKIPRNCKWILCEDLNIVEHREDKSSLSENLILNKKCLLSEASKLDWISMNP
jgi:hypothetical protein